MESDISIIIRWWFYLTVIGIIFLPLTRTVFSKFFDKGYIFSKAIGILLSSYVLWILSSLRLVPFFRISIFSVLILFALFILVYKKGYRYLISIYNENRKIIIWEEIGFLVFLLIWCYVRGLHPDIYGLEKFMDYGFVNSILKTEFMPPVDMWLSGKSINYYYYGHYICAFLVKLIDVESSTGYNIMLAMIFSFTFMMTFSIASNVLFLLKKENMKRIIAAGIISSMLVTFGGTFHTFIFATALPLAKEANLYKGEVDRYFYADSTRYIGYNPETNDKTIHEFPFYSFVVSDLHGHVSDIPYVLTMLMFILAYIIGSIPINKFKYIAGLMLGLFYMTNAWDLPIYITVTLFAFIYRESMDKGLNKKTILNVLKNVLYIFLLSRLVMIPYTLNFVNMTGGVGLVQARTPLYQLLILWGYQLLLTVFFKIFLLVSNKGKEQHGAGERRNKFKDFFLNTHQSDIFISILLISAFGLVIIPEIVYVRDIYGVEYHRANTMFKLVYQSFIMLGIAGGYIAVRTHSAVKKKSLKIIYTIILAIVLLLPMQFPYYAVKGYYTSVKPSNYKGLYGLDFLRRLHADDYEAVKWLNENVKGQPVILEANGDGYTDYERISMSTGLPTVLGWFGHEWLWRGGPDIPNERSEDISSIYEGDSHSETKKLLQKYQVKYIILGSLERNKFKNIKEDKIMNMGTVAFNSGLTKIIEITP
ncbi:hypothetical protein OXPF_01520 [Oxobacter pfennigii]|uniref:Chlor_Arch_YYY domain protein n=1 Tax=Oxobacter pfennigii TaxID=36849 RepID=A0A0P8YGQ5_9CLOT|nr:DUF2298 domain-containing protein [Oxobacter pfennigii]KPU46233.1 hypothetical protein OXPF_01520 [Oxobacter pfennigii]